MSNNIRNGESRSLAVPPGQSIAISSITGTVTATVTAGTAAGTTLLNASTGGGTFGPYASGAVVLVTAGQGSIVDYDIGFSPVNAYSDVAKFLRSGEGDIYALQGDANGNPIARSVGNVILINQPLRSIIVPGGDHPYADWWGTNGKDGLAQMYFDQGHYPYIAICADESSAADRTSGYGATLGKPGMLSILQAQTLEALGVEFISHGARHTHFWDLFNTGIRVWYTGAEATPTVNISTTQLTTSTAVTGATNFTWVAYPTLAQLQTAIRALAGWNCELATELLGTEPTAALMPLNAARSVATAGGSDPQNNNQRFALVGGIMLRYSGTAYKKVAIACNDSGFFSLYADGARLLATTTNATLTTVVAAINALNITGLTALVMDNGFRAQTVNGSSVLNPGQLIRESYCYGDESALSLQRVNNTRSIVGTGFQLCGGMGFAYAVRRQVECVKERAASLYGITIKGFAQSGGRLFPWHVKDVANESIQWRANRSFTEGNSRLSPAPLPVNHPSDFTGVMTSTGTNSGTPYGEADVKAIWDVLAENSGWMVDWLNHLATPTPLDKSPYTGLGQQSLPTYTSSADQDEGPLYRELVALKADLDSGAIDSLTPTESARQRVTRKGPTNHVFNPKFRNGRSDNLLGLTSVLLGSGGIAMPGWNVTSAASDFTTFSVDSSRTLTITTNGALASNKTPLGCDLLLEPGKTYHIGAVLNLLNWGAANSVRWVLYPLHAGFGEQHNIALASILSTPFYGGFIGEANFDFTVPNRSGPTPARVQGVVLSAPTFTTETMTVNVDNKGAVTVALNGLTTAKAIAAAVNTAIAADSNYVNQAQYHTCASAVDNRLVVTAPLVNGSPSDSGSLLQLANGTGTPLATLFGTGVTSVRDTSDLADMFDTTIVGYRLMLLPSSTSATQTLTIRAPYARELKL